MNQTQSYTVDTNTLKNIKIIYPYYWHSKKNPQFFHLIDVTIVIY